MTDLEKTDETTKTKPAKTQTAPKAEKTLNVPFETFWDEYDKKIDPKKCEPLWRKLSDKDRLEIMSYLPKYKQAQPDKQFRKNPQTWRCHQELDTYAGRNRQQAKAWFLSKWEFVNKVLDEQERPTQPMF